LSEIDLTTPEPQRKGHAHSFPALSAIDLRQAVINFERRRASAEFVGWRDVSPVPPTLIEAHPQHFKDPPRIDHIICFRNSYAARIQSNHSVTFHERERLAVFIVKSVAHQ